MTKIWEDENLICVEEKDVQYIQFKKLLEYPEIKHCYTLRKNLNFPPIYKNEQLLKQSYEKICRCLNLDYTKVIKPHQTHTTNVEIVNEVKTLENVDGLLTNKAGLTLLTTSADCISLLLYDPIKKVIGSIHSGWRGTLAGMCKTAINKMIQGFNSNSEDIICCICPSIRKCCFEVDEDVKNLFYEKYKNLPEIKDIIIKDEIKEGKQKYKIDTVKINICLLKDLGLKEENIIDSNICTVCHSNEFHSYRADKEGSGRNAALIGTGPNAYFQALRDRSVY